MIFTSIQQAISILESQRKILLEVPYHATKLTNSNVDLVTKSEYDNGVINYEAVKKVMYPQDSQSPQSTELISASKNQAQSKQKDSYSKHHFQNLSEEEVSMLKDDITDLVIEVVEHNEPQSKKAKNRWQYKISYRHLGKCIQDRISNSKRNREEMIKYIVRKSLKYYRGEKARTINTEEKPNDHQQIWENLPFRKGSDNKTVNKNFLSRIFNDPDFMDIYQLFQRNIETIFIKDNQRKIKMFSEKIVQALRKSRGNNEKFEHILRDFKSLPWLKANLEKVQNLVCSLPLEFKQ